MRERRPDELHVMHLAEDLEYAVGFALSPAVRCRPLSPALCAWLAAQLPGAIALVRELTRKVEEREAG